MLAFLEELNCEETCAIVNCSFYEYLMASGTFATADFSVQVGEINTYEVVSSNWSLTDNTNSDSGTGSLLEVINMLLVRKPQ